MPKIGKVGTFLRRNVKGWGGGGDVMGLSRGVVVYCKYSSLSEQNTLENGIGGFPDRYLNGTPGRGEEGRY